MDDSCAVCADSLEWVGYGSCRHREVCATCAIRLRFVLEDRRCCICKTESPTVFITRALGNYTRIITDFSVFPAGANEGQVSSYWYHEGSQAYFDDVDQYRMIKAMCRLSCSMCDKSKEEQGIENTKRRSRFRSIEQLKGHLFHQHRMFMCSLCLQGRKVFICEQKLYTRSQLNQHIHTGDSEVDGSENERGGFMGHPMCEFCKNPFYGDNELYMHMSTEHYTCHICQRQHPGQYDYFRNYDDLETHFRQEHFLCENDTCLTKKFIVFQTEAEMKRHNMIEHGDNMSRSKRNAALQIPTSFRYRQSNDQDQRRGRGRGFRPEPSNNQLSMAIQASLETAFADGRVCDLSSSVQPITDRGLTSRAETTGGSSESFSASSCSAPQRSTAANCQSSKNAITLEESYFPPLLDRGAPGPSSRYAQALNPGAAAKFAEELFPPLPSKKQSSKNKQRLEGLGNYNTLASRLNHGKGTVKVLNSGRPKLAVSQELTSSNSASFPQLKPIQKSQGSAVSTSLVGPSNSASFPQLESVKNQRPDSKPHATSQVDESSTSTGNEFSSPVSTNSTLNSVNGNKMKHSSSTHLDDVSKPTAGQSLPRVEDVHTANKSLVERIRVGLENDEEKFAAFKSISAEYRQGQINTWEYISYVEQFGLMHLVLELARLCPDPQKQQELIDAYNSNIRNQRLQENGRPNDAGGSKDGKNRKNEKGKSVYQADDTNRKDQLADSFRDTVRKLQLNQKHQEEVEVLSKDGYRTAKSPSNSSSSQNPGGSGESSKQRRKTSKFFRARLGDESSVALLDVGRADSGPDPPKEESSNRVSKGLPLPVQGVWKNKGGQKLFFK